MTGFGLAAVHVPNFRLWPNSAAEAQSLRADKNQELSSSNEHFKRILVSETEVSVLTR